MKTQSADTRPEAERIQVELLRKATGARRFALARSLSHTTMRLSREAIRRAHASADEASLQRLWVALQYSQSLADHLPQSRVQREGTMDAPELVDALTPVVVALEQLGVAYHIGGSVASSFYGIPRSTLDIDLVADLRSEHVHPFVEQLQARYYVDEDAVREALRYRSSFNLLYLASMMKVDVFIPQVSSFDQQEFQRAHQDRLEAAEDARLFYLASAEDTILRKLLWYKLGNMASDQQWKDVLGILKVQADALDLAYLRQWAEQLEISALLARTLLDAGLVDDTGSQHTDAG
jgi:hypothetical protein